MITMKTAIYDELALERIAKEHFRVDVEIGQVILHRVKVSPTTEATLFLTKKKQLLLYVDGQSRLILSDIKKIVSKMSLVADEYLPPKGQSDYFDSIGREKFSAVFPGRSHISDKDIVFYRTLAPYSPALVQIAEVKDGQVYQYDSDSKTKWRPSVKFTYRRIKTS